MLIIRCPWRGGRVVEGADLESLLCGNVYEGSNPSLSVLRVISEQLSKIIVLKSPSMLVFFNLDNCLLTTVH